MDATANAIGWLAAGISTGISLPQAAKIWRARHSAVPGKLDGVALGTWILVTANAALWLVYAILVAAYPVGFPSLVNGPLGVDVVVSVLRDRRAAATQAG